MYEILNDKNKAIIQTGYFSSIANINVIKVMFESGYKIKENGKYINKTRIIELLKEHS